MSTEAVAEPPVETPTEEKPPEVKAPEVPPKKEEKAPGRSMVDDIRIVLPGQSPEAPKEEKKPEIEPPVEEKPKDETKVEAPKVDPPSMSPKARDNFARVEKERDEARQQAQQFDAELKKLREQSSSVEVISKRAEEAERKAQELSQQLRTVSLERDPEFIGRFERPRTARFNTLVEIAKSTNYEGDVEKIIKSGDSERIEEIRDLLPITKRAAFDSHLGAIADLDFQRQEALKDSEKTSQQFEIERSQQYVQANVKAAERTISRVLEMVPVIKDDTELLGEMRSMLNDVAGATENSSTWDNEMIMTGLAMSKVQDKILKAQAVVIKGKDEEIESIRNDRDKIKTDSDAKIESLKKELEDRDSFIKKSANGYPRSDHTNGNGAPEERKLTGPLDDIRIVLPGGRYV